MSDFGWKFKVWWWRWFDPSGTTAAVMWTEGYTDIEIFEELRIHKRLRYQDLKALLLAAPSSQLHDDMKTLIETWDSPPSAAQVREVLDPCTHYHLASSTITKLLFSILHELR